MGDLSRGQYHGGRRLSSDDCLHSPNVIPPSALDKLNIMKHYHHWRTTRWDVTARSPTMVALHDTWFVECRWWNDGWTVKTVVTWQSSASMITPRCWSHAGNLISVAQRKQSRLFLYESINPRPAGVCIHSITIVKIPTVMSSTWNYQLQKGTQLVSEDKIWLPLMWDLQQQQKKEITCSTILSAWPPSKLRLRYKVEIEVEPYLPIVMNFDWFSGKNTFTAMTLSMKSYLNFSVCIKSFIITAVFILYLYLVWKSVFAVYFISAWEDSYHNVIFLVLTCSGECTH